MNINSTSGKSSQSRFSICVLMFALFCLLGSQAMANRKTDIVYLKNGDRITGEFKTLKQGELKMSTSEMGTISIKWTGIARIESDKYIEMELTDGTRIFGEVPAELNKADDVLAVKTLKQQPYTVDMRSVVKAEQIRLDESFWDRLDGNINLGLNYTQASDIFTWNFAGEARYRTPAHLTSLGFNSNVTSRGDGSDTSRNSLIGSRYWYSKNRWFYFGNLGAQQNDELGLKLRVYVTGGAGRFLIRTQKTELYLAAGLSGNKELETGTDNADASLSDAGTNLEGLLAADYTFFKLYSPKSRIKLSLSAYPGITDTDRVRGNANLSLRQEFFSDLFWDLSFYYDYDSKPLQGAEAKEDYGIVTSLGYEF
jgi:hypothetical protein